MYHALFPTRRPHESTQESKNFPAYHVNERLKLYFREVYELQQKVQRLEAMLAASKSPPDSNPSEQNKEQHQLSARSSPQTSRYVGKESGIRWVIELVKNSQGPPLTC